MPGAIERDESSCDLISQGLGELVNYINHSAYQKPIVTKYVNLTFSYILF